MTAAAPWSRAWASLVSSSSTATFGEQLDALHLGDEGAGHDGVVPGPATAMGKGLHIALGGEIPQGRCGRPPSSRKGSSRAATPAPLKNSFRSLQRAAFSPDRGSPPHDGASRLQGEHPAAHPLQLTGLVGDHGDGAAHIPQVLHMDRMSSTERASAPTVGSSSSSTLGVIIRALARWSRRCIPPE